MKTKQKVRLNLKIKLEIFFKVRMKNIKQPNKFNRI